MEFLADLHVHSYLSRSTSSRMRLGPLSAAARRKGLTVLGSGDFTHPAWFAELSSRLEPAEPGLFRLRAGVEADEPPEAVPSSCLTEVRFVLSCEVSTIYKRDGRTRKVHHVILMPDLAAAARLNAALERVGNLRSDGRPILGLDSEVLLRMTLDAEPTALLIPAHVWTPHFSVFGATTAFSTLEECYGPLARHLVAVETGLSSDPPMNWRCSALDRVTLVSNSDAHSPDKLGREANRFATELSYGAMSRALATGEGFAGTLEFHPGEGKYHLDGHRLCGSRLSPAEARRAGLACPACGRPVTVGVLHRVESLADRPEGARAPRARPFELLVPLAELLGEVLGVGPDSKRVREEWGRLVAAGGGELPVLRTMPLPDVAAVAGDTVAEGVRRMRAGEVQVEAGFDGQYGRVRVFADGERPTTDRQGRLF